MRTATDVRLASRGANECIQLRRAAMCDDRSPRILTQRVHRTVRIPKRMPPVSSVDRTAAVSVAGRSSTLAQAAI